MRAAYNSQSPLLTIATYVWRKTAWIQLEGVLYSRSTFVLDSFNRCSLPVFSLFYTRVNTNFFSEEILLGFVFGFITGTLFALTTIFVGILSFIS